MNGDATHIVGVFIMCIDENGASSAENVTALGWIE